MTGVEEILAILLILFYSVVTRWSRNELILVVNKDDSKAKFFWSLSKLGTIYIY